jgi:hypothetical protein
MKCFTYKISPNNWGWHHGKKKKQKYTSLPLNNTWMYHQHHTEPAQNRLIAPECSPKQTSVSSPKPTFDNANCLDDQTRALSSTRPVSDHGWAGEGRGRGVNWFTRHKSIIPFLGSCARGFQTKTCNDLIDNCREKFMLKKFHVIFVIRNPLVGSTIFRG